MNLWQFTLAVVAIVLIVGFLAFCEVQSNEESVREAAHQAVREYYSSEVSVVTVKGHEYIVVKGSNKGGIAHSESCPCKEGGAK